MHIVQGKKPVPRAACCVIPNIRHFGKGKTTGTVRRSVGTVRRSVVAGVWREEERDEQVGNGVFSAVQLFYVILSNCAF